MRIKLGLLLLILVGLVSIFQPPDFARLRALSPDPVLITYDRARCLRDVLPAGVHLYGFLPPIEEYARDKASRFAAADDMRRLFLLRSVLAPDLVVQNPLQAEWVIAYFADQPTGLAYLAYQPFTLVHDCQNGVFLLRR